MTGPRKLVVATRIHGTHCERPVDLARLPAWLQSAVAIADGVLVGCDSRHLEQVRATARGFPDRVEVVHISPWTGVVGPLNALLARAGRLGASHVMFRSLEVDLSREAGAALLAHAGKTVLVVGARLAAAQWPEPGQRVLDGMCAPWNTLAVWSIETLALTGFLAVSDGLHGERMAGVEEVVAISVLQSLRPRAADAVLLDVPGVHWRADFADDRRRQHHEEKVRTKRSRSHRQLEVMGIVPGTLRTAVVGRAEERAA